MFGLKAFAKTKEKQFKNGKERKRYFAIREYYRKKAQAEKVENKNSKTKGKP